MSDGFEKKGPSEAASIGESLVAEDMKVYEESVDLMLIAGLSREECEKILFDDTNPYVIWYLDFMDSMPENGWEVDANATKKGGQLMFKTRGEKKSIALRNPDRLIKWQRYLYPHLVKLIERWGDGLKYEDVMDGVQKTISDRFSYPGVETWIGLVSTLGFGVSNKVQKVAFAEIVEASGGNSDVVVSKEVETPNSFNDPMPKPVEDFSDNEAQNKNRREFLGWIDRQIEKSNMVERQGLKDLEAKLSQVPGMYESQINEYLQEVLDYRRSLHEGLGWRIDEDLGDEGYENAEMMEPDEYQSIVQSTDDPVEREEYLRKLGLIDYIFDSRKLQQKILDAAEK